MPDHLWAGTKLENEQDKKAKGRHKPRFRMYCRNGHLLQENSYILNGKKKCRACEDQLFQLKEENKKLTEQVEKMSKEDIYKSTVVIPKFELELSRLREREKELVEALRELNSYAPDFTEYPNSLSTFDLGLQGASKKAKSLLSKFEVPNT